jgi:hypothetical protein
VHDCVAPVDVHIVLGAVQNEPKLVQQGCPSPPQVPHDPAAHMLPTMVPHTWPAPTQRTPTTLDDRMQQPPSEQTLLGQQG